MNDKETLIKRDSQGSMTLERGLGRSPKAVRFDEYLSDKAKSLTPYAAGIQPQGEGWIKLNTNENPYPPSPKVIEALRNADMMKIRLYPDGDSGGLCAAVAESIGLGPENVFAGNGSDEVLALAFQAFFSGKSAVLMPDTSYGFYSVWSCMYDVGVKAVPLREDFSLNASDYTAGAGAEGVVIANPNAPTGMALPLEEIERVARNNPSGVVLIDEAYIDFANVKSAVGLINRYDNLLVARTLSKSCSLAGLRVGFALGSAGLIRAMQTMKNAFNSYPLDMLAQTGGAAAVRDADYRRETAGRIIKTREGAALRLRALGYNVLPSQANFLFMESDRAEALYNYLFANKILVRYWNKPRINCFLRVTVGTDEDMEAFIQCVKRF